MTPVSAPIDAMCCDRLEMVTACENRPANFPSMRMGVSSSRMVVPRVGVQNGACQRGPVRDAPASSHAAISGRSDQSSVSGSTDDPSHLRLSASGSVMAIPSTCGTAPRAPRMNWFSAGASPIFTYPRSICSAAHRACRITG